MGESSFVNLQVERSGATAVIQLDRPAARNALDAATLRELARAIRAVRRDPTVRVLVVTGRGDKAFCAGADVTAMATMTAQEGHAFSRLGHEVFARLEALPIPAIAALNGVALGGGLELALACDLIVASERARVGQPEINLGIIPGFGGTQRLVLRVGLARARELIYRGHTLGAAEAHAMGIVDRVAPADDLRQAAMALAEELAAKAPVALREAKRATRAAAEAVLAAGCQYEIEAFGMTFASDDRVEGVRAFLEKRAPTWKGR